MRAFFSNSFFARALGRTALVICRHRVSMVYVQIILALAGALWAARFLKVDLNRDHLVGSKMKYQQIHLRFQREFPGEDELAVIVESNRHERNRQFIERLAARIKPETNLFSDLFYKGDLTTLGSKALLLAPASDLQEMRKALHDYRPFLEQFRQATNLDSLFGFVNQQFRNAGSGNSADAQALIDAIPFLERIVNQAKRSLTHPGVPPSPGMESLFGGGPTAEQEIYVTFASGDIYLLTCRAKNSDLGQQAIEKLRALIHETELEVPGVNAGLTGESVLDYDETHQSERDSLIASIAAMVLCSLIFIVSYRELERPLKSALCLLIGLGYTIAFTTLAIGHLNILTVTFAPMLIGLGIDFGIHFTQRYEEEMRNGRGEVASLRRATVFTGQGIVTGAFTTSAAFLAMALTHFTGIREMGIISGGGLLLCLVPMMTALPALLMSGRQNQRDRRAPASTTRRATVERLWLQRPGIVVLIGAALCAGALLAARNVRFDYNLLHMQSRGLSSVLYEKKLIHSTSKSVLFGAVMADSPGQAREYEQKIKALPSVASIDSLADYFAGNQNAKLALVRSIKGEVKDLQFAPIDTGRPNVKALSATLWSLSGYLGLAIEAAAKEDPKLAVRLASLSDSIGDFRKALNSDRPHIARQLFRFRQAFFGDLHLTFEAIKHQNTSGPLTVEDLPSTLRDRFIGVTGKFLLQVYPKGDLWQHDVQQQFIRELRSVIPEDKLSGTPIQLYEYTTLLKNSYEQAAWYSLGAIAVMVLLHFRSVICLLLALLPVAVGGILLLGLMGAAGVRFNPANVMTLPLVVGIGVTNGIQILNRFSEEQKPGILARSTGKAVLVSGLTAIAGFGSLMLARHRGIKSLGEVMAAGITACLIVSLTLLPCVIILFTRLGWKIKPIARGSEDDDLFPTIAGCSGSRRV